MAALLTGGNWCFLATLGALMVLSVEAFRAVLVVEEAVAVGGAVVAVPPVELAAVAVAVLPVGPLRLGRRLAVLCGGCDPRALPLPRRPVGGGDGDCRLSALRSIMPRMARSNSLYDTYLSLLLS